MRNEPIDVTELPRATTFLNYRRQGPLVGKYLGPNMMGEYFTVVSRDIIFDDKGNDVELRNVKAGLAYGVYTINGEPTDPAGLPPAVAVAKLQRDWMALKR